MPRFMFRDVRCFGTDVVGQNGAICHTEPRRNEEMKDVIIRMVPIRAVRENQVFNSPPSGDAPLDTAILAFDTSTMRQRVNE